MQTMGPIVLYNHAKIRKTHKAQKAIESQNTPFWKLNPLKSNLGSRLFLSASVLISAETKSIKAMKITRDEVGEERPSGYLQSRIKIFSDKLSGSTNVPHFPLH